MLLALYHISAVRLGSSDCYDPDTWPNATGKEQRMARSAFKMRLKPGAEAIYKEKHDAIWPEMVELLHRQGVSNYSIFRDGLDLYAYLERDDDLPVDASNAEINPVQRDWWLMMEEYMEYNDDHTPKVWPLDEVFHLD
jgi:L-rhamnose mutarotase